MSDYESKGGAGFLLMASSLILCVFLLGFGLSIKNPSAPKENKEIVENEEKNKDDIIVVPGRTIGLPGIPYFPL